MPDRPLRIALVAPLVTPISEPQRGGSQALVADLAVGFTERGHVVHVYAASGSIIDGATVVDTGVDSGALAPALYRHGTSRTSLPAVADAFDHVFAAVAAGDYDIVHNHGFDPPALRRHHAGAARVIHTVHLPPEPEAAAALLQAQRGPAPAIVVGLSASHAEAWRPLVKFDRVIRPGVPVRRIPWSDAEGAGVIFAGRLSPEKGAREAVEIALMAGHEIDVYGSDYDADYGQALRSQHRDDASVRFHPAVPRRDLWRHMTRARAVLCPVDWDEPFGLVAAEAQAAGTPVVGFARGALTEVVADGLTGFLVEPGDVPAAAAAVRSIGAIERGACRRHAADNLDMESCVSEHEDLYTSLVTAATSGPARR